MASSLKHQFSQENNNNATLWIMNPTELAYRLKVDTLKVLINRRTPNWALSMLVLAFAYFFWDSNQQTVIFFWLLPNFFIILVRGVWLHSYLDNTSPTPDNIDRLLKLFCLNVGLTSLIWSLALPQFFMPHEPELLLVFIFTYFILLVSGTLALASHWPAFISYCTPFLVSFSLLFFFYGSGEYASFGVGFILFNVFVIYLYRITNQEVSNLIQVQLEKQSLADDLEDKRQIALKSVEDKNRFLAAASHDLRQPLHTTGLLVSALEGHVNGSTGKQLLDGLSNAMGALSNSFNSLLDVSKLDAGVVQVDLDNIELNFIFNNLHDEFRSEAERKGISLRFPEEVNYAYTDANLLERILRNFISNAIKYTKHGAVAISVSNVNSSQLTISIRDSGPGIPEQELSNIFSEYYQLDNPERDRNKGFGLGLAIVQRLCNLLSIPLNVTSKMGAGTCFSIDIPKGDKADNKPLSEPTAGNINLIDKTILVIDDDTGVLDGMHKLLSAWGCNVICAEDEDQALILTSQRGRVPDITIADYRLRNNQTGTQVCERIQEEFNRDVPSIIVTGDTSPERLQQVLASGFLILHKPVTSNELRLTIEKSLES